MSKFCDRLKNERKRLGLNQDEFAALGGVKKGAQFNYENGSRIPDIEYVIAIGAAGVDMHYLLHAVPSSDSLSDDEAEMVSGYRKLDVRGKAGVLGMISGLNTPTEKVSTVISGNSNHVVQGNQTVKAPLKLKISTTKKNR